MAQINRLSCAPLNRLLHKLLINISNGGLRNVKNLMQLSIQNKLHKMLRLYQKAKQLLLRIYKDQHTCHPGQYSCPSPGMHIESAIPQGCQIGNIGV